MIGGIGNIILSGSLIGSLSGSFIGTISSSEYTTSTPIFYSNTSNFDITGSFSGSMYLYNYIGSISGIITGSAYITNYTGTYTYLSQSVANTT